MKIGWKIVFALVLLGLVLFLWLQLPMAEWIAQFRLWILGLGMLGIVAFVLLYVLVTALLGPASALTLSAGLAYGAWGFPLVIISATLAACVAFLLGRYVAHERVNQWIARDARLSALNTVISLQGWRVVGLLRLSPILPYGVQNYLFSVTSIRFVPFTLATMIGIMPATALYVYIGSLGQAVGTSGTGGLQWVLVLGGLLATIAVAWFVGRQAQVVLAQQVEESSVATIDLMPESAGRRKEG
ncbi:TVP38/TMEM64 family protein [Granulosicoccus antarcticus]|uniref:TVP38/TMEM64 family membrane protein n=1 Tax=Granulosicoccus antarcticus IMCC3135 TaxID=1192854 RepID=A0A2Z2NZ10_9GAMM|nr:TVP38/TMEM64 family protein [Granulosicoccus antarcticus]ASJ76549.1 TVP38/TMEM64 family inner membrane protein YdjZ [Granulosicoccus antarcticus IMCC3135]